MVAAQLSGGAAVSCGLSSRSSILEFSSRNSTGFRCFLGSRRNIVGDRVGVCSLSLDRARGFLPCPVVLQRKQIFPRFNSQLNSDCGVQSSDVEETSAIQDECDPSNASVGLKYEISLLS